MNKILKEKINEAFSSVLPISVTVLILGVFVAPMPIGTTMLFLIGTTMLIVGMGFFSLGSDMAMLPMGEGIGVQFTKTKKLFLVVILCFAMGIIITIAEPDLQVLATQTPGVPKAVLIGFVAVGVGIFLVAAILRILFQVSLPKMLVVFYTIVFIVAFLAPKDFMPIAFDSGGVTTGPITVPFIMALGLGVAHVRSDKNSYADSFGLVGLSSVGPILMVLLLGIVYKPSEAGYTSFELHEMLTIRDAFRAFTVELPTFLKEVGLALSPIILVFAFFQIATKRYKKRQLGKMAVGFVYTFIGLVLFLTGVNVGFIPVGNLLGSEIASSDNKWLLIPLGILIGYFIVLAEPAVHVLNKQVEEVSGGTISSKVLNRCLSIGVAVSVGISMLRILTGISIFWFLIPGYAIALTATFFVPKIFTGVAFDSGGVASGPMTSTFLLPFAIGACEGVGGNVLTDAFGVVAMVAMTPIVAIQMLGLIYNRKAKAVVEIDSDIEEAEEIVEFGEGGDDDEIVEYDEDEIVEYDHGEISARIRIPKSEQQLGNYLKF